MDPFPQDWELISLFECEPEVALPDAPWDYNQLSFVSRRGDDHIVCEITARSEELTLTFRWWHRGTEHISLQLDSVRGLVVEMTPEQETLVVFFPQGSVFVHPLRIQLKPFISLTTH